MEITSEVPAFAKHLVPGDVIIYDSLSSISGLIQWADNAQANHTSIMLNPTQTVMANVAAPGQSVIQVRDVVSLLENDQVRGAIALRHADLGHEGPARDGVVRRINDYLSIGAEFSLVDLVAMAPAALFRSYKGTGFNLGWRADTLILLALDLLRSRLIRDIPADKCRVFCSEFVFRCLTESEPRISVTIEYPITDPAYLTPETAGEPWDAELLAAEQEFWSWFRGPTLVAPPLSGMIHQDASGVRPDLVTPGDLWCSPSFERVILLAKPPRPRPNPDA